MSSAALVPSFLERAEASVLRRPFLSVLPALSAASVSSELEAKAAPTTPSKTDAPGVAAAAEKVTSVPPAPTVAGLHADVTTLPAPAPANAVSPSSQTRPTVARLESELVAMLPSLERRAYRWCRDPAEAQDLAQDTVLRALGNGARFDSEGHLRAWLYTVLRNLFISRRRRAQSWQRASGELCGLAQQAPAASPASTFLTPSVERAIASLPEAFARVICLVDLEDYSYADAASTLGVPVGTVMSRLFRARQRLARDLPGHV